MEDDGMVKGARRVYVDIFFICIATFYFTTCTLLVPPVYFLYVIGTWLGRSMEDYARVFGRFWFYSTAAIAYSFIGEEIIVHYDPRILKDKRQVFISNHCTYLDWIFLWAFSLQIGKQNPIFVVKKAVLKLWFLSGGMKMLHFIFLERKISVDGTVIDEGARYVRSLSEYLLVLFPEGTFIDKTTKEKSDAFFRGRKEHGKLPSSIKKPMKMVLIPRITGFKTFCSEMEGCVDSIIDSTVTMRPKVGYPADYYTLSRIFHGKKKPTVEIYCDYYPFSAEVLKDEWLYERFLEKERFLEGFYKGEEREKRKGVTYNRVKVTVPFIYKVFIRVGGGFIFGLGVSLAVLAGVGGGRWIRRLCSGS